MIKLIRFGSQNLLILDQYFQQICPVHYPKEIVYLILIKYYDLFRIKIGCGFGHTILLKDNKVYAWGDNGHGQLGLGDFLSANVPNKIKFFASLSQREVMETEATKTVKKIYCGGNNSFALTTLNNIYVWGRNYSGELGLGGRLGIVHGRNVYSPEKLEWPNLTVKQIVCGEHCTIALTNLGELYGWGLNEYRMLGLEHSKFTNYPKKIVLGIDIKIKKIAYNCGYVVALTTSNEVYAWGTNGYGQLGLGHNQDVRCPQKLPLQNIQKITCGDVHAMALNDKGEIYVWGFNGDGQLGLGHFENIWSPSKLALANIKKIICGTTHSMAISHLGEVYAWGENNYGQLGLGHCENVNLPQKIQICERYDSRLAIKKQNFPPIKKIITGGCHNIAISIFNEIYGWGDNEDGQLMRGLDRITIPRHINHFG